MTLPRPASRVPLSTGQIGGGARSGGRDPDRSPWARGFREYTGRNPHSQEGETVTRVVLGTAVGCGSVAATSRYGPVPARKYSPSAPTSWIVARSASNGLPSIGLVRVGDPNA